MRKEHDKLITWWNGYQWNNQQARQHYRVWTMEKAYLYNKHRNHFNIMLHHGSISLTLLQSTPPWGAFSFHCNCICNMKPVDLQVYEYLSCFFLSFHHIHVSLFLNIHLMLKERDDHRVVQLTMQLIHVSMLLTKSNMYEFLCHSSVSFNHIFITHSESFQWDNTAAYRRVKGNFIAARQRVPASCCVLYSHSCLFHCLGFVSLIILLNQLRYQKEIHF